MESPKLHYGAPSTSASHVMHVLASVIEARGAARTPADRQAAFSLRFARCGRVFNALLLAILVPLHAAAADDAIDPTLIPDGTYPAHVDRVIDPRHLEVTMQGTLKIFLTSGRWDVTFNEKLKSNDDIAVTLTDGKVTAFKKNA